MDANSTPEQSQNNESNQLKNERLAQQAVQEIMSRLQAIENSPDLSPQEKAQQKIEAAADELNKYKQTQETLKNLREATRAGEATEQQKKDIQNEQQNLSQALIKISTLADNDVRVVENDTTQRILRELSKVPPTDSEAEAIQNYLGDYLLGEDAKDIIITKPGETKSDFMDRLDNLASENPAAADKIKYAVGSRATDFGLTQEDMLKIFKPAQQESQSTLTPEQQQQQLMEAMGQSRDKRFGGDAGYYETRFTDAQKDLLATFYDPEKFVNYMERLSSGDDNGRRNFLSKKKVQDKKEGIKRNIEEYYKKNNKSFEPGENLETLVEKQWGEEVSKMMEWNVSDVINQLFLELQQKSPNKFYEQIMQEDIFQGPGMIQKRIQAAINALMTEVDQIEGGKDDLAKRMDKLNLYQQDVPNSFIEERGEGPNRKIYPRIHPLAHGHKVGTTDYIRHLYQTIDQTISKAEYFHNSRAIYGHPPGEKGFYQQLGDFAEQMKGGGIDEILMLPDGQYMMEAYQLYEKMLQEDFAQLDHRHRPDQLSNKLERVNPQIVIQIFEQLRQFYPELSNERLWNIVNSGVGISRGIFLTEAEKSAYADPIDSEGKGMIASYSTNDAGSLNVFNPMHTILRWQGEHFMNAMYFMPVNGQPGPWNHRKAMDNAAKYMDSFLVGKGRGKGKDALPEEVFLDSMMDLTNVGGPSKRKGWRLKYSLDGHFIYDKDGTINAPETFKAMEAIGYEAINNFYVNRQAGDNLLKATEKTAPDQVNERKELFKYIFKRYFSDNPETFQESEFESYWSKLQIKGEEKAMKQLKEKGSPFLAGLSWEEQIAFETSQLFMKNTLARYTAARFPTIFLRMDKNRLHDDGISHWEKIWREFRDRDNDPWIEKGKEKEGRARFDKSMKNLTMAEMLLRRQISEKIRNNINLDEEWSINKFDKIDDLQYRLNEKNIRELLSKNKEEGVFKSEQEIKDAIEVFRHIKESFKKIDSNSNEFLDGEGIKRIQDYTFTFGMEDTDISLMNFRGTGPRMVARAVKDVALAEQAITPWIIEMPRILNEIAINGKHDFSPIIEYMRKAQKAITEIHDVPSTYQHMYKIAGTVINYFKKDAMAKPLFGLFRIGKKNSWAAEYAGRSTAVWEWDSRDIDRFAVAMESYGLLKNSPYDLHKFNKGKFIGGELENRWIKIPGIKKPIKFGKKRHVDYEYNSLKLRREHGADWKAITWDYINQFLPLAMAFLLWKYIKDAMDETEGKKKQ